MSASKPLLSPCIDVCKLDARTGLCVGCFRSLDEIAAWSGLPELQRVRIRAELAARREHFARVMLERGRFAEKRCGRCGAPFACGAGDPGARCWCESYPAIAPLAGRDCLCPACLAIAAEEGGAA